MHADAAPEIVVPGGDGVNLRELLERGADAERPVDARTGHRDQDSRQVAGELRGAQVTVGIDEHGSTNARRAPRNQIVCVGFEDDSEVPSVSSTRARRARLLSSFGKRTPTPWVRPPDALAGVIQPTLPATG